MIFFLFIHNSSQGAVTFIPLNPGLPKILQQVVNTYVFFGKPPVFNKTLIIPDSG